MDGEGEYLCRREEGSGIDGSSNWLFGGAEAVDVILRRSAAAEGRMAISHQQLWTICRRLASGHLSSSEWGSFLDAMKMSIVQRFFTQ